MGSPSSTPVRTRSRLRTAGGRIGTALVLAATAVALPPASAGQAAPRAAAADDTTAKLTRLEKKAKVLAKEYRGEIVKLTEVKDAARRATLKSQRLDRDLRATRQRVAQLAANSYMTGGVESIPLSFSRDPQSVMEEMALAEYLARQNGERLKNLETLAAEANQAKRSARTKVNEAERIVTGLERQRTRVKALLTKFKVEKARKAAKSTAGSSGGGLTLRAKSALTGNFMTDRMRRFYLEVDTRFGPFETIGCHRPGDPQDHGTGRACDFMESFGVLPSAQRAAHGDRVAQFAIDNASRLGLKYVIWKQRIYDVRSPGWRQMEDRGSITQNHFDHVHISVF